MEQINSIGYIPPRTLARYKRQAELANLKVTTAAGNTFDANEVSQDRLSRAVVAMQISQLTQLSWVLADNTTIQATLAELSEALALAVQAQTDLWVPQQP